MAAMAEGTRGRTRSREPVVQEFVPSSAWTEDSEGHYLLVDLPEFKKEEVRVQVDNSGNITVSGERMVSSNKYVHFEQAYKMPENSDIYNVSAKFEGEILYVTLPKLLQFVEENNINDESDQSDIADDEDINNNIAQVLNLNENNDTVDHQDLGDHQAAAAPLERAMKMIKRNKAIFLAAVIAIALGVLVSLSRTRFDSAEE